MTIQELLNWFINMDFKKNPYYWISSIKKAMDDEENEYEFDGEAIELKVKNGIVELEFVLEENIPNINMTHFRDTNKLQLQELQKYIEAIIEINIVLNKYVLFETKSYNDFLNYKIEPKNSNKVLIILELTNYQVVIDEIKIKDIGEYSRESFENMSKLYYEKLILRKKDGLLVFENEQYNGLIYRIYKE